MKPSRRIIIRKHRLAAETSGRGLRFLKGFGLTVLCFVLILLTGAGIYFAVFSQSLPSLDQFRYSYASRPDPTRFYARDGETILFTLAYENFESRDLAICEEDGEGCFPRTFIQAARIAGNSESTHKEGLSEAEEMVQNIYSEYISRSRFPDLTSRLLTRQVLSAFGEDQILNWYYNNAWFGQMAFGLDAAARLYLDKPGDSLSDAECVLLSSIINAPMLNPIDANGAVRDSYLGQLALLQQAGLFSEEEAEALSRSNFVIFEPPQYINGSTPDIITRKALDSAIHFYGRERVERGGLRIITSEDASVQRYLQCILTVENRDEAASACPISGAFTDQEQQTFIENIQRTPVSIALIDTETGQLLGAEEAQTDRENRHIFQTAFQAYPIGTGINYFAALTAFSGGSSPSTLIWDLPNNYETDSLNPEEPWHGPVQLREALSRDYQRPLTAHLKTFGSGSIQRNAALFGLSSSYALSENNILSEGSSCTAEALAFSLLPFASLGDQIGTDASGSIHPVSILRVERDNGDTDLPQSPARKSLIAPNLAYLVHNVFSQNTGPFGLPDRPSAVKTGTVTSSDALWVSGYTTRISCALRIGTPGTVSAFIDDSDKKQETAEILWRSVMEFAHREIPASGWETPSGIATVKVCLPSGKLPSAACRETATELFLSGNEPYEYDEYYVEVPINRENRMLATRFTPAENIVNEVFLDLPDDAAEWAETNGIEQIPAEYDPIRSETGTNNAIRIEAPAEFQSYSREDRDKIDVIVRLSLRQKPESLQVSIGQGMFPSQWTEVCSGGSLENGQWLLCSLDPSELDSGLYVLRTAFILPNSGYQSAETYFEVE